MMPSRKVLFQTVCRVLVIAKTAVSILHGLLPKAKYQTKLRVNHQKIEFVYNVFSKLYISKI